jgi:hypothetical protein
MKARGVLGLGHRLRHATIMAAIRCAADKIRSAQVSGPQPFALVAANMGPARAARATRYDLIVP